MPWPARIVPVLGLVLLVGVGCADGETRLGPLPEWARGVEGGQREVADTPAPTPPALTECQTRVETMDAELEALTSRLVGDRAAVEQLDARLAALKADIDNFQATYPRGVPADVWEGRRKVKPAPGPIAGGHTDDAKRFWPAFRSAEIGGRPDANAKRGCAEAEHGAILEHHPPHHQTRSATDGKIGAGAAHAIAHGHHRTCR